MRKKFVIKINKISKWPVFFAALAFFASVTVIIFYGLLKWIFFNEICTWVSHSITIFFASIMASGLAFFVAKNAVEVHPEFSDSEEKSALYDAAMTASMHGVGNALNLFQLIQIETENGGVVSEATLDLIESELMATKDFMKGLSLIENPTAEVVMQFLKHSLNDK